MANIKIDQYELNVLYAAIPRAAKMSQEEQLRDLVRRFSLGAMKNTPPLLPSAEGNGGKRRSWKGTRAEHTAFLRGRILGMRLPRGYLGRNAREKHMSKAEARAYYSIAARRQGELLSGWNAAAEWSGAKFPNWIKRHGKNHGAIDFQANTATSRALVGFVDTSKYQRTNIRKFAERARDRALYGLKKQAEAILQKRISKELAKQGVKK